MDLDRLSCDFAILFFCQTARFKENKKDYSRHTIRKIHINIFSRSLARGAEVAMWRDSFGMPNGTKTAKKIKRIAGTKIRIYKENGFGSTPCDFAICFFAKRHEVKKNKKICRHTLRKIHRKFFYFYVFPYCVPVSLFIFPYFVPFGKKKNRKG